MKTALKHFVPSLVLYLILLSALPLRAQSEIPPEFVPGPCPVDFPARNDVECGLVIVPQDRLHPQERTLNIAVAIFKAQSTAPEASPVLFLDGGPGARTIDSYANGLNSLLALLNQRRDVVVFDYRGIGYSEPALTCPEAADAVDESWVSACRNRFADEGVDVTDFTTRDNATDAADIMRALGYTTYNIWGGSYGSSVAMTMLRDHPENIRAALVTALQPPQGDLQAATPVYILRTLDAVSALCAADATCATAFPGDLTEQLTAVVERLEANPLPLAGGELEGLDVLAAVSELLKDEKNIPLIPGLIAALHAEQYDWITPYANVLDEITLPPNPYGAWLSMRCTDSILATTPEAIDAALRELDPVIAANFLQLHQQQTARCEAWGARVPTEADRLPAVTDVPVLIISGAIDPFSSQEWLDAALTTLTNGQGYMLPYHMHYVIQHPCAEKMLVDFIDDPAAEIDSSCIADVQTPLFK